MPDELRLTKRQSAVLNDMFAGELDEQAILEKHRVSQKAFNRWLADDAFGEELRRRMDWLNLQSELVITRYKTLAAAKLVQLTDSENQETARKACLDIISLPKRTVPKKEPPTDESQSGSEYDCQELSPEMCSRLLAVLAEQKKEADK